MDIMVFMGAILLLILFVVASVIGTVSSTLGAVMAEEDEDED